MISENEFITIRELSSGTIYKRSDGILVLRQAQGKDSVTIKELEEQLRVFLEIQKGELSPIMIVVDRLRKLDNEEKMFLMSTISKFASKVAMVTGSAIPTFIFNILLFLFRPTIESKVFYDERTALEWLKQN